MFSIDAYMYTVHDHLNSSILIFSVRECGLHGRHLMFYYYHLLCNVNSEFWTRFLESDFRIPTLSGNMNFMYNSSQF